jgi:hypothetical protein
MDSIPRMAGAPTLIKHSADDEPAKKPEKDTRPWWVKMFVGSQLVPQQTVYMPSAYRTSESSQSEQTAYLATATNTNWQAMYTVPVGKTYYMTKVTGVGHTTGSFGLIGISGSLMVVCPVMGTYGVYTGCIDVTLPTPVKFVQGSVISFKRSENTATWVVSCAGYLE